MSNLEKILELIDDLRRAAFDHGCDTGNDMTSPMEYRRSFREMKEAEKSLIDAIKTILEAR